MRLIVTGGGTGGHVYPALEVARAARDAGWEVIYLGSNRGQEGKLCKEHDFEFHGFPSEPIFNFKSLKGLKAASNVWRSIGMAKKVMAQLKPDALLSTGGYSSAPVVGAAKSLYIPTIVHEQNTVPGRTNRLAAKHAYAIATTFKATTGFGDTKQVRTGLPIRRELRASAQGSLFGHQTPDTKPLILVMGGSQGAVALNEAALATATRMAGANVHWLCIAGVKNYDAMHQTVQNLGIKDEFDLRSYLNADEMASALFRASVVVCRSGGSLAEVAAFRKPSVLVPFPSAMGNHQYYNAKEFESIGAAMILPQYEISPISLEGRIRHWIEDRSAVAAAESALAEWDTPQATQSILDLVEEAARA